MTQPQPQAHSAEVVAVEQVDRDAAAEEIRAVLNPAWADEVADLVVAGKQDTRQIVQAFARHRQTARTEALETITRLRQALREIYEEYAGSEGFPVDTASEAYCVQVIKRMADIAGEALAKLDR